MLFIRYHDQNNLRQKREIEEGREREREGKRKEREVHIRCELCTFYCMDLKVVYIISLHR
jgi:Pyruvate/2-oxoacid:ferredoxin oxidoreductase delta subunit